MESGVCEVQRGGQRVSVYVREAWRSQRYGNEFEDAEEAEGCGRSGVYRCGCIIMYFCTLDFRDYIFRGSGIFFLGDDEVHGGERSTFLGKREG